MNNGRTFPFPLLIPAFFEGNEMPFTLRLRLNLAHPLGTPARQVDSHKEVPYSNV